MGPCFYPCPAIGKLVIVLTSAKGTWIKPKRHFGLQGPTQSGSCLYLQLHLLSLRPLLSIFNPCCLLLLEHISRYPTPEPLPLIVPHPKTWRFWQLAPYHASLSSDDTASERFSLPSCGSLPSHHPVIPSHIILLLSQHSLLLKILLLCTCLLFVSPASL